MESEEAHFELRDGIRRYQAQGIERQIHSSAYTTGMLGYEQPDECSRQDGNDSDRPARASLDLDG